MTLHATSAFTITGWEPETIDDRDGVSLTRTKVTKTFTGDLEGTSVAELLMAGAPNDSAAYVGFERIEGKLNGRAGSFILHHNAISALASNPPPGPSWRTPEPASYRASLARRRSSSMRTVATRSSSTMT